VSTGISKVNNFLENRSIVSVERTEKKRNYFTCNGYLGKKKNLDYLSQKESNIKTKKKTQFKPPFKSTKEVDKNWFRYINRQPGGNPGV
jgi:hypothetical protein